MASTRNSYSFSNFSILFFIFIFLVPVRVALQADTISVNQNLSGDKKLTSEKGKFVLGFFKPDNTSSNWYIGIWYGKISVQTVVWVANRENPVTDPTKSEFMISGDGNLILFNQFKNLVWSTNYTKKPSFNSSIAVILDTGNLVLRDEFNSSKVMWQCFDQPTNTWLPGARLGFNKITGVSQYLISWKDENNPAPGLFSLMLDPSETDQYKMQWNKSVQYWTSGKWNGAIFESVPEMGPKNTNNITSSYTFAYANDTDSIYFTYSAKDESLIMHLAVDVLGRINAMTWREKDDEWLLFWAQPAPYYRVYGLCGSFGVCNENLESICQCVNGYTEKNPISWGLEDYSEGCMSASLQCESNGSRNGNDDKFYEMTNMTLSTSSGRMETNSTEDCEMACLNNCSCTAYSYNNGCSLWYNDLINLQVNNGAGGETFYLRLASSEFSNSKENKRLVVGVVLGACFVLASLSFGLYLVSKKRRRMRKLKRIDGCLTSFRHSDLQYITKNFSEQIGKGGYGSVFKGILLDSTIVAVKRLEGINQGDKQFRAEISTIGAIQHLNLIRLFGFCSENEKKLLVYEYMSMGSLDRHLFRNTSTILTWKIRYQIALGISRGLLYLHEKCRERIIHCDIKPENILLDDEFAPKIADFGQCLISDITMYPDIR